MVPVSQKRRYKSRDLMGHAKVLEISFELWCVDAKSSPPWCLLSDKQLLLLLSRFSHVRLCVTPWTAAYQAPPSLDSSGKNTGVGCHFLLQCRKVKSESEVAQSCLTLSDPMDCSPPGSSIHGIFQARVLEWVAIAFSSDKQGSTQKEQSS